MVYGFLAVMSDVGGVLSLIISTLSMLISPISEHSFYTKAMNKLYLAFS
jgi:hypothetical protein